MDSAGDRYRSLGYRNLAGRKASERPQKILTTGLIRPSHNTRCFSLRLYDVTDSEGSGRHANDLNSGGMGCSRRRKGLHPSLE